MLVYQAVGLVFDFQIFQHNFDNPVAFPQQRRIVFQISRRDQFRVTFMHERRGICFQHLFNRAFGQH